jgi:DNA-directed RNA polymerase subunit F
MFVATWTKLIFIFCSALPSAEAREVLFDFLRQPPSLSIDKRRGAKDDFLKTPDQQAIAAALVDIMPKSIRSVAFG